MCTLFYVNLAFIPVSQVTCFIQQQIKAFGPTWSLGKCSLSSDCLLLSPFKSVLWTGSDRASWSHIWIQTLPLWCQSVFSSGAVTSLPDHAYPLPLWIMDDVRSHIHCVCVVLVWKGLTSLCQSKFPVGFHLLEVFFFSLYRPQWCVFTCMNWMCLRDFDLDLDPFVHSGKCVYVTVDHHRHQTDTAQKHHSYSTTFYPWSSGPFVQGCNCHWYETSAELDLFAPQCPMQYLHPEGRGTG